MSELAQPERIPATDLTRKLIVFLAFPFFALLIIAGLAGDILSGGNVWKQGDWLINNHHELVRRGILGSWILDVADITHISPLYVVGAVQAFILLLLISVTALLFNKLLERREYCLLLASPGFFLIFWTADPRGALRKEMIIYCALALALTYPLYRSKLVAALAAGLFVIACLAHEAGILFLPLFGAILYLVSTGKEDRTFLAICGVVAAIGAVVGLLYGAYFSSVSDTAGICKPLLDRGLSQTFCDGAIWWLDRDSAFAMSQVIVKQTAPGQLGLFALLYALAFAPIVYFASLTSKPQQVYLAYALAALPIFPLYVLATDWGRWLDWQVTSVVFVTLALALTGRLHIARPVPTSRFAFYLLIALLSAPRHEVGAVSGGLVGGLVSYVTLWR